MKNFHQNCPLFRNLENEDSALAALCARNKNYEKGEFLLHAGEPTREFGILTRGTAHIVREDEEGNPVLVAELGSGELFAEAFALVGTPLAVSVIAASDCEALWLCAQKFADAQSVTWKSSVEPLDGDIRRKFTARSRQSVTDPRAKERRADGTRGVPVQADAARESALLFKKGIRAHRLGFLYDPFRQAGARRLFGNGQKRAFRHAVKIAAGRRARIS